MQDAISSIDKKIQLMGGFMGRLSATHVVLLGSYALLYEGHEPGSSVDAQSYQQVQTYLGQDASYAGYLMKEAQRTLGFKLSNEGLVLPGFPHLEEVDAARALDVHYWHDILMDKGYEKGQRSLADTMEEIVQWMYDHRDHHLSKQAVAWHHHLITGNDVGFSGVTNAKRRLEDWSLKQEERGLLSYYVVRPRVDDSKLARIVDEVRDVRKHGTFAQRYAVQGKLICERYQQFAPIHAQLAEIIADPASYMDSDDSIILLNRQYTYMQQVVAEEQVENHMESAFARHGIGEFLNGEIFHLIGEGFLRIDKIDHDTAGNGTLYHVRDMQGNKKRKIFKA